jgi:hypothetical protein
MTGPGINAVSQHAFVSIHVVDDFDQYSHVQCSRPRVAFTYVALSVHLKSFLISDHMFHIRFLGLEAP